MEITAGRGERGGIWAFALGDSTAFRAGAALGLLWMRLNDQFAPSLVIGASEAFLT